MQTAMSSNHLPTGEILAPLSDAAAASAQQTGQINLIQNAAAPLRMNRSRVTANIMHSNAAIMGAATVQAIKSHAPTRAGHFARRGESAKPAAHIHGKTAAFSCTSGNISEQADCTATTVSAANAAISVIIGKVTPMPVSASAPSSGMRPM